jgi:2-dehydropantoate 2-reductase
MNGGKKVAVVGVGAIGGAVAAALSDLARHDLVLCARTPFDQLEVRHPEGTSRVDAIVLCDPTNVEDRHRPADWILLATKAHHSVAAKPWFEALCGSETHVAVLQNGVDHVARVGPLIEPARSVLPVVVRLPSEKTSPGRVSQSHSGSLAVPDDALGQSFASLFEGARIAVEPVSDFLTQSWWKLIMNASLGGVCALTIRENSVAREPALRNLVLSLLREAAEVGRAEGAKLPEDAPEKVLDRVLANVPGHWSSITVDRREGRSMEWQVRNEVVCRIARSHGIETPMNDAVTAMLRVADASWSLTD